MVHHKPLEQIKARPLQENSLDFCESINIKLIYGTQYIHTPTGPVEKAIKTLEDNTHKNLWDDCTINEALGCSLNVMRTTDHSRNKKNSL